jgi:hypothetical protein
MGTTGIGVARERPLGWTPGGWLCAKAAVGHTAEAASRHMAPNAGFAALRSDSSCELIGPSGPRWGLVFGVLARLFPFPPPFLSLASRTRTRIHVDVFFLKRPNPLTRQLKRRLRSVFPRCAHNQPAPEREGCSGQPAGRPRRGQGGWCRVGRRHGQPHGHHPRLHVQQRGEAVEGRIQRESHSLFSLTPCARSQTPSDSQRAQWCLRCASNSDSCLQPLT